MYSPQYLEDLRERFDQEETQRFIDYIELKRSESIPILPYESDCYCRILSSFRSENNEKAHLIKKNWICDDFYFNFLFPFYWHDIHGVKRHYDHLNEEMPKGEIIEDVNRLSKFHDEWLPKMEYDRHKDETLQYLSAETREQIRNLKKDSRYKIDGILYESRLFRYAKKLLILYSKYIHYKVELFFSKQSSKSVCLYLWGHEIIFNAYSMIHILFRHYAKAIKMYNTEKTYHTQNVMPEDVLNLVNDIFEKISGIVPAPCVLPQSIYFRLKGLIYVVWLKPVLTQKKGHKGNIQVNRLETFYPVELHSDITKIMKYTEINIKNDLVVFKSWL